MFIWEIICGRNRAHCMTLNVFLSRDGTLQFLAFVEVLFS